MSARRLDGKAFAAVLRSELTPDVEAFARQAGRPPVLQILLAGDDPASQVYVRGKEQAGADAGLDVRVDRVPATTPLDAILSRVAALNNDDGVDGILVQSPLPVGMGADAEQQVFDAIDPDKDVDGFHPRNVGLLVQGRATLTPCTPTGVMALLDREGIDPAGRHAVVIGRSDIVGKPMAMLLLHRHATVTICHSRTKDLRALTIRADILVAAVGRPGLVTPDAVRPGAVVIDVGMNRIVDRDRAVALYGPSHPRLAQFDKRGSLLVGDVHPAVAEVAGALTPVPGGVGPLTIAMLLRNTLLAATQRRSAAR